MNKRQKTKRAIEAKKRYIIRVKFVDSEGKPYSRVAEILAKSKSDARKTMTSRINNSYPKSANNFRGIDSIYHDKSWK